MSVCRKETVPLAVVLRVSLMVKYALTGDLAVDKVWMDEGRDSRNFRYVRKYVTILQMTHHLSLFPVETISSKCNVPFILNSSRAFKT